MVRCSGLAIDGRVIGRPATTGTTGTTAPKRRPATGTTDTTVAEDPTTGEG